MISYPPLLTTWTTPNGHPVAFELRAETNDWNTVNSCLGDNDEYALRGRPITGWALDIGAHIGSVAVAIAVDNPASRVLAVEPVPDNVRLIRINAARNGVADRVLALEGSVGPPGVTRSEIRYGYRGNPSIEHHAFIGNTSLAYDTGGEAPHEARDVETLGIAVLLDRYGIAEPAYTKIDCEGGEWPFLRAPLSHLRRLPYIRGEWHNVRGHVQSDLAELLARTHDVEFTGPVEGPGGFVAVRR